MSFLAFSPPGDSEELCTFYLSVKLTVLEVFLHGIFTHLAFKKKQDVLGEKQNIYFENGIYEHIR